MKRMPMNSMPMNRMPMTRVSEGPLFPPLKKGGRGDLLFMSQQIESPLPPLSQTARPWLQGGAQ